MNFIIIVGKNKNNMGHKAEVEGLLFDERPEGWFIIPKSVLILGDNDEPLPDQKPYPYPPLWVYGAAMESNIQLAGQRGPKLTPIGVEFGAQIVFFERNNFEETDRSDEPIKGNHYIPEGEKDE